MITTQETSLTKQKDTCEKFNKRWKQSFSIFIHAHIAKQQVDTQFQHCSVFRPQ